MLVRDRERNRAGTDTDVQDPRLRNVAYVKETALDDALGLGARDQRARVDVEVEPTKAPLAEDVGERLPVTPAADERLQAREGLLGDFGIRVELAAAKAKGLGEEAPGIRPGRGPPALLELGGGPPDCVEGCHATAAASRPRRRSSAARASVNSSRSPSTIRSSRLMVRL